MAKYKIRNLKVFKQTFEVSIKTFCRKWEVETLPKRFFIFKELKKCQNEYYPYNLNLISFCRLTLFPHNTLVSYFLTRNFLIQEYIGAELRIFFIVFEELFEWQK